MKKFRIILLIILLCMIALLIVPWILNMAFKFDLGIWHIQSEWSAGEALAFYGSILSGLFTLLGVMVTIKNENAQRKKDEAIKYKPILELIGLNLPINSARREVGLGYGISYSNSHPNKGAIINRFLENQCGKEPQYTLFYKNIGRGETFNATVDSFEIEDTSWTDISGLSSNISTPQYIGEIIKDGVISVGIKLPTYLIMPKDKDVNDFELSTRLYLSYSDMFNRIRYQYVLYIKNKVLIDEVENEAPEIDNEDYHYVKVHYEPYEILPTRMIYSKTQKGFVHNRTPIEETDYLN